VSDLESTAHEAVANVQPLLDHLDEAHRECDQAVRYIHTLSEQLTTDRQDLQDAVDALAEQADHAAQALSAFTSDATEDLERVATAVISAREEWEEVFGKEEAALAGAAELLPGLAERIKELTDAADATSHGVLDWATRVAQELEHTVEAVEQFVGVGLPALLADWRREADAVVHKLTDFFDQDCEKLLAEKEADWRDKLPQLHEFVEHAFQTMTTHGQEVAAHAGARWSELLAAQLEAKQKEAQELGESLNGLTQAIENYEGQLQAAGQMVAGQQEQAATDARQLASDLNQLRGRWGTFGITC
jgi:chromosome segregation ATPase